LRNWLDRGDSVGAALTLEDVATWLIRQSAWSRAVYVLAAAAQQRERAHALLTPQEAARHAESIAQSRAYLDEPAFSERWAEGRAVSLEQVIEIALVPQQAMTLR